MTFFSISSKSVQSSKRSSMVSAASQAQKRLSISSDSTGVSYFVQFPFTSSQPQASRISSRSSGHEIAEMMDDDNAAWGKPNRKSRR